MRGGTGIPAGAVFDPAQERTGKNACATPAHSYRKAVMGSTRVARRAGM